jgi:hypothetical protein
MAKSKSKSRAKAKEDVTTDNLGDRIYTTAKDTFGKQFKSVKQFLRGESEKLAITLRMIIEARIAGDVSEEEARILLNQQKIATSAVLTAAEGMSLIAVQSAINAALNVVRQFVNGKVGFSLL